jgi:hypothetical protein
VGFLLTFTLVVLSLSIFRTPLVSRLARMFLVTLLGLYIIVYWMFVYGALYN